jgi:two-component system NtrC family response regulator
MINAIDGMLAAGANDSTLYAKHLPLQMRIQIVCSNLKGPQEGVRQEAGPGADGLPAFKAYRESSEYKYLQELMRLTHRNIPEACRVSGISRSRLYEMLAKYGLNSIK